MTLRKAEFLLAAIISARASGYMFSKLLLIEMGPFTLMGLRFLIAFALMAIIFHRRFSQINSKVLFGGIAIGLMYFLTMTCELWALVFTSSTTVSFLENIAIVLVPVAGAVLLKSRITISTLACALLALVGVAFLTLGSGFSNIGLGELLGIGSAVFYAAAMLVTARYAKSGDALLVGIVQIGCIGILGMICSLIFETPTLPSSSAQWIYLGVLVIVCTGFGFTLQPLLQKYVSANQVGMMCALSPLIAAVLGVVVLGETLEMQGWFGSALIMVSVVVSTLLEGRENAPQLKKHEGVTDRTANLNAVVSSQYDSEVN